MSDKRHERVGLFGGTFDPPHVGHLILASEAKSQLELTRILWTVTPDPPHKQDQSITSLEHRLAMVRLAIQDDPSFELSDLELNRPGPHYTIDTIRLLAEQNPKAEIVPIIGGNCGCSGGCRLRRDSPVDEDHDRLRLGDPFYDGHRSGKVAQILVD